MTSYTDTILLEANRKSSVEFLGGNTESPSKWNNDLGSGIKLDIGDTISVESGYISEIGNEEATIEIIQMLLKIYLLKKEIVNGLLPKMIRL